MTNLDTPGSGADAFARHAMVASAFLAPLLVTVSILLSPFDATAEGEAYVRDFTENIGGYALFSWLAVLSAALFLPGLFAVSKVARRGRPTLGLAGMILAFILAVPFGGNSDDVLYAANRAGLDTAVTTRLMDAYVNDLPIALLGSAFFLGLLGLLLLGVAALLGRSAATWAAAALIAAPILLPIPWLAGMGNVVVAVPWLILTAGMGGVALSLLRRPRPRP
nr:hypothetical protein GCM10020093_109840 [Planobispora longispora]